MSQEPEPRGPLFHARGTGERTPLRRYSEIPHRPAGLRDVDHVRRAVGVQVGITAALGVLLGSLLSVFVLAKYEVAIAEDAADDPTPYLRIARIYRDELGRPEDAALWLRRALTRPPLAPGQRTLVRREYVELCRVKLGAPEKAAPMLARWAEEDAGTPDGDWAAAELAEIKAEMRAREEEAGSGGQEGPA